MRWREELELDRKREGWKERKKVTVQRDGANCLRLHSMALPQGRGPPDRGDPEQLKCEGGVAMGGTMMACLEVATFLPTGD